MSDPCPVELFLIDEDDDLAIRLNREISHQEEQWDHQGKEWNHLLEERDQRERQWGHEKNDKGHQEEQGGSSGGDRRRRKSKSWIPGAIKKYGGVCKVLECCWDVPETLSELYQVTDGQAEEEDLRNVLATYTVLLGDGKNFAYLTTEDYLEKRWGEVGLTALRILSAAVTRITFGGDTTLESGEVDFPFETQSGPESHIHFRLLLDRSERQNQLESALRWLCAAVRRLPSRDSAMPWIKGPPNGFQDLVWISVAEETRRPDNSSYYKFSHWTPRASHSPSPKPSCWTDLFMRGTIIESPASRTWGEGLETSFATMVTLAGVENMYQIDDGIILLGFFTALVPISRHEKTNSIQWHLETKREGIDPRRLECTTQKWFRTTDIHTLTKARCFIGWFEKAHVMLGTRQLATDEARRLQWTGLESRKETIRHVGLEAGVQAGGTLGPINIVGQSISTFAVFNNKHRYPAPVQFLGALNRDSREVALVIDAESRRAWLVPLLSWTLHLCHRYYIEQCSKGDTPIPFAKPSSDGAKATLSAVESKGGTVIFGDGREDAMTLRQLWLQISTSLGKPQPGQEDPRNGLIFAAEAMDATMSRDSYPKEIPFSDVSAAWAEFSKLAKITTVCANLGNAIVPVPPSGKLCECCTLLENQDFLAAHTWSLARLLQISGRSFSQLEEKGLQFENGTSWRVCSGLQELWTDCPAGENCRNIWDASALSSSVLQRLEKVDRQDPKGKGVEKEPPIYDGRKFESGVVVFGGHPGAKPKSKVTMSWLLKALNDRFGSLELLSK